MCKTNDSGYYSGLGELKEGKNKNMKTNNNKTLCLYLYYNYYCYSTIITLRQDVPQAD